MSPLAFWAQAMSGIWPSLTSELMADDGSAVQIVEFDDRHADAFRALNLAWISEGFTVVEEDERQLENPSESILARGGEVFLAVCGDRVVGTCALLPHGSEEVELAKLTVSPEQRGTGIGSALMESAIQRAQLRGARRIVLLCHTKLSAAVRLYRRYGFVEIPLPDSPYEQANLAMALDLPG